MEAVNPLQHDGFVSADAFCNQRKELADLREPEGTALDLIDREDGAFVITDRFFKLWIRRM